MENIVLMSQQPNVNHFEKKSVAQKEKKKEKKAEPEGIDFLVSGCP